MTGSGVETISHIKEPGNARVTLMWTSFLENPNIVRCWGKGKAYEIGTKEFQEIVGDRKLIPGTRAVVVVDVWVFCFVSKDSARQMDSTNLTRHGRSAPDTRSEPAAATPSLTLPTTTSATP